jgi:hypothetical protein
MQNYRLLKQVGCIVTTGIWRGNSVFSKEEIQSSGNNLLLYVLIWKVMKLTVAVTEEYHLSTTYIMLSIFPIWRSTSYIGETFRVSLCGFWYNLVLVRYSAFIRYQKEEIVGVQWDRPLKFKKTLGRKEVFCNIHIELGIPMKLVRIIKLCLKWDLW